MSIGNVLPCCCGGQSPTWLDCDFVFPSPAPVCGDTYTMSDFEATVDYQMRYVSGGVDSVVRWSPQYIPSGCTGITACEQDTSIVRSYSPASIAIRNAQMTTNCKVVDASVSYSGSSEFDYGPSAGTRLEYDGIDWNGAAGETDGVIEFDATGFGAYPPFPMFTAYTRCNVPPFYGQACPNWGEPHPSVENGKFEMLVIQTQGVGYVEYCSGSTPTQRSRWLTGHSGLGGQVRLDTFGFRSCNYQAIFLYWRDFPSDPTDPAYTWEPGSFQFYGVRLGVFDYIVPPPGGSSGGCGTTAGFTSSCAPNVSPTCCCCAARATGSLAATRRYYASGSTQNNCGNGNRLRPSIGMFPWNAAVGDPVPPGLEFDCPESMEIG